MLPLHLIALCYFPYFFQQWHQEALSYLLRLLCQFAVVQFDEGDGAAAGSDVTSPGGSTETTTAPGATVSPAKRAQMFTMIPKLNKVRRLADQLLGQECAGWCAIIGHCRLWEIFHLPYFYWKLLFLQAAEPI